MKREVRSLTCTGMTLIMNVTMLSMEIKKKNFDTPLLGWLFIFVLVWINFLTITYKRKIEKINKIKEINFFS